MSEWPAVLKNFTPEELASPDDGGWRFHPAFPDALQKLRDITGVPLFVTSCCRSKAYNSSLTGASPRSLHIYDFPNRPHQRGTLAIDIKITSAAVRHHVLRNALMLNWSCYLISDTALHLDCRYLLGEQLAFWV